MISLRQGQAMLNLVRLIACIDARRAQAGFELHSLFAPLHLSIQMKFKEARSGNEAISPQQRLFDDRSDTP
jgi:hypothetical protein